MNGLNPLPPLKILNSIRELLYINIPVEEQIGGRTDVGNKMVDIFRNSRLQDKR